MKPWIRRENCKFAYVFPFLLSNRKDRSYSRETTLEPCEPSDSTGMHRINLTNIPHPLSCLQSTFCSTVWHHGNLKSFCFVLFPLLPGSDHPSGSLGNSSIHKQVHIKFAFFSVSFPFIRVIYRASWSDKGNWYFPLLGVKVTQLGMENNFNK